jgi:molybdopterin/thiamine biosynthesis adenylyltransferase
MDLNKSREYFDPAKITKSCHIIGCGAIGSSLAELLARQGVSLIHLWDYDVVESHNLVNQMYRVNQINKPKTEALAELILEINPDAELVLHGKYTMQNLSGFVFIATDSIASRRTVVEQNWNSKNIEVMFDFRMTLLEGQHYAYKWDTEINRQKLLDSMDFTDDEAKTNNPVSACGFDLSVAPTVRAITALGVSNFMSYVNTGSMKKLILSAPFSFVVDSY